MQEDKSANSFYQWYRNFVKGKTRNVFDWVFAIWVLYSAQIFPQLPGIAICFLGATIRFWAGGYLRKDNRLAAGGPYAWIRNPLYFGRWLMAIGVAISIENYPLAIMATIILAAIYHYTILDEETKLIEIFGEPYRIYCATVPRFIPRLWPASAAQMTKVNPEAALRAFDWSLAWTKNKGYEAYLSFFGLIGGVALIAYIWGFFKA